MRVCRIRRTTPASSMARSRSITVSTGRSLSRAISANGSTWNPEIRSSLTARIRALIGSVISVERSEDGIPKGNQPSPCSTPSETRDPAAHVARAGGYAEPDREAKGEGRPRPDEGQDGDERKGEQRGAHAGDDRRDGRVDGVHVPQPSGDERTCLRIADDGEHGTRQEAQKEDHGSLDRGVRCPVR